MDTLEHLTDFIRTYRDKLEVTDSNLFAFGFSKVTRYYQFVALILGRYERASAAYVGNAEEFQRLLTPGVSPMSPEMMAVHSQSTELTQVLHLEIESFYLFAKILLDNIARATEYHFGPARGCSLDSHDDLAKKIGEYAKLKGLTEMSPDLIDLIASLKKVVSDHRDYDIAHEKSPRTMKGTVWTRGQKHSARISSGKLYPTDKDAQVDGASPTDLIRQIDRYVDSIIDWIKENDARTRFQPRADQVKPV